MIYAYTRCSTEGQAEKYSIPAQVAAIAQQSHYDAVFMDKAVSGSKPFLKRLAGRQLMDTCQAGDCIVVSKLDRGFRDTGDAMTVLKDCRRRGIALRILDISGDDLTNSIVGELMMTVLAAVATFEKNRISERTKEGLARAKASGVKLGAHRPQVKNANKANKANALRWAEQYRPLIDAYQEQELSQSQIANMLNLSRIKTRTGGKWTQPHVSRLIQRLEVG